MYALPSEPREEEVVLLSTLYETSRYVMNDSLTLDQLRSLAKSQDEGIKYIKVDVSEDIQYEFVEVPRDLVSILPEPKISINLRSKIEGYSFKVDKVSVYLAHNQGDYSHTPNNLLFGPGTINSTFMVGFGFVYDELMKSFASYSVSDLGKPKVLVDDVFQITTGHGITLVTPQIILTHDEEKIKSLDRINLAR